MSVEHMSLVFKATHDKLGGSEKLLLLAYTNWTDARGYCWPSERRLAHVTGCSLRTVQRTKQRLTKIKLIKSIRRKSPKTGDPISNLTRVNLDLLRQWARPDEEYDDNLIDQITFGTDHEEPPSDLLTRHPDGYLPDDETPPDLLTRQDGGKAPSSCRVPTDKMSGTPRQDDGQSLSDPSEISLSHPPTDLAREVEPAEDEPDEPPPPTEPESAGIEPTDADAIYDAYDSAHRALFDVGAPGRQVHSDAVTLLASGWPVGHLMKLAGELPAKGYASLARHAEHNPPPKKPRAKLQLPPPCEEHVGPDLPMRMIETPDGVIRCPECNPHAKNYRGPRVPLPSGDQR